MIFKSRAYILEYNSSYICVQCQPLVKMNTEIIIQFRDCLRLYSPSLVTWYSNMSENSNNSPDRNSESLRELERIKQKGRVCWHYKRDLSLPCYCSDIRNDWECVKFIINTFNIEHTYIIHPTCFHRHLSHLFCSKTKILSSNTTTVLLQCFFCETLKIVSLSPGTGIFVENF